MRIIFDRALLQKNMLALWDDQLNVQGKTAVSLEQLSLIMDSFASLGCNLDADSVRLLHGLSAEQLKVFYNEKYLLLALEKGVNVQHKVFYPNFPNMEGITPQEYYIRAALHYVTAQKDDVGFANQDLPQHEPVAVNNTKKTTLHVVDQKTAENMLVEIGNDALQQNLPIPESAKPIYKAIWTKYAARITPSSIPFKESMAFYINTFLQRDDKNRPLLTYGLVRFCKTVTDLLRVYAIVSGEVELRDVHFVSLPRSSRKVFLQRFEELCSTSSVGEDLQRHEFLWKRATELLHPYDFRKQFPTAFSYICDLRNDMLAPTFYSALELSLCKPRLYVACLATRPTEFARRLDFMLRTFDNQHIVLEQFRAIADKVSVNVLVGLWKYYLARPDLRDQRNIVFYSQGSFVVVSNPENRKPLCKQLCDQVIQIVQEALFNRFKCYPQRGKLYIAPCMSNYMVPASVRNASAQTRTLTLGTTLPLDGDRDCDYVRLFTHWRNCDDERIDIDLSIILWDEQLNMVRSLWWRELDASDLDSFHSGDFTTAPDGASEFIDLNLDKAAEVCRYVSVHNVVFTGQSFASIPECFSGAMFLPKRGKKGEVFNPQFVKHKFDLVQSANNNMSFVFDVVERKIIWADCNTNLPDAVGLTAVNDSSLQILMRKVLAQNVSIADWMKLHLSHLELTEKRDEADFIVEETSDANVSPFDIAAFSTNWM